MAKILYVIQSLLLIVFLKHSCFWENNYFFLNYFPPLFFSISFSFSLFIKLLREIVLCCGFLFDWLQIPKHLCVFLHGAVFLFKPFHVFEIRGGEKIHGSTKHASRIALPFSIGFAMRLRDARSFQPLF